MDLNLEFRCLNTATLADGLPEPIAAQLEPVQLVAEGVERHAELEKGTERHITADPGKGVKIGNFHGIGSWPASHRASPAVSDRAGRAPGPAEETFCTATR